jgi:hypothetical protein
MMYNKYDAIAIVTYRKSAGEVQWDETAVQLLATLLAPAGLWL